MWATADESAWRARQREGMTPHVVIAGGGVGALEGLLALQDLAGDRVHISVLTAARHLTYRPPSVAEPFGSEPAPRYDWERITRDRGGALDPGRPRGRPSRCARRRHQGRSAGPLRRAAAGARRPAGAGTGGCHHVRRPARRPGHPGDDRGAGSRAPPQDRVRRHGRHRMDPAAVRARAHDGRVRAAARARPGDRAVQRRVRTARRLRRRRQLGRTPAAERRRHSLSHRHLADRARGRDRAPSPCEGAGSTACGTTPMASCGWTTSAASTTSTASGQSAT